MAVDPAHRSRGIGSLLMETGVSHADSLDLECWMEASSMGKPLYEKFGFQSLMKFGFDTEKPRATDEWRKCAHELTPPPLLAMWRPKQGAWKVDDGRDVHKPWDLGVE
jgi:predicted N-acetyltransferase YhbS